MLTHKLSLFTRPPVLEFNSHHTHVESSSRVCDEHPLTDFVPPAAQAHDILPVPVNPQ